MKARDYLGARVPFWIVGISVAMFGVAHYLAYLAGRSA